jgi:uncharacterized protein with ParB-like and HNH nuclease domain
MQQIIPLYKSISELLSGNKFTVDEYQREYKWDKQNIIDLIYDLLNKFRASYKEGHSIREVVKYEDYFLGSIILNKKDTDDGLVFSIVDGQQRITSITLLLIHLYHVGTEKNIKKDILSKIEGMIYSDNWGSKAYNLDISDRKIVLEHLFKRTDFDYQIYNESVRNMYKRYSDIETENIEKELGNTFENFLYWICNRVKVIEIFCQSLNQAYDIFETMNDRGKPLSPTDMLKSFFLSFVNDPKQLDHLNSVWRNATNHLNTWNNDYSVGSEITFFKTWFRAKYTKKPDKLSGETINKGLERINNFLNRWARENAERLGWSKEEAIISLIENDLKYFSEKYTIILEKIYKFDDSFSSIYYNDEAGFSRTWQTTILLSAIKLSDDKNEVSKKLKIVSKYIDIWIASRFANGKKFTSNDIKEFANLMLDIRNMSFSTLKNYFIEKIDSNNLKIINKIQNDKNGIKNLRLNRYTKKGIKYILARISEFIEKGSTEKKGTHIHWFLENNDIEHIIEDNYELYKEDYAGEDNFNSYRNKIGALLLIRSGTNKSFQDRPFIYKKYFYSQSNFFAGSLCESIYVHETGFRNFIKQYSFDFKPYEKFSIKEIDERTDLIACIADYIWNKDRIIEIE